MENTLIKNLFNRIRGLFAKWVHILLSEVEHAYR